MKTFVYEGVDVASTYEVAKYFGVESKHIEEILSSHKERFLDGEHLVYVEEMTGYAWTMEGVVKLSKQIDTPLAWEWFEKMYKVYFATKKAFREF